MYVSWICMNAYVANSHYCSQYINPLWPYISIVQVSLQNEQKAELAALRKEIDSITAQLAVSGGKLVDRNTVRDSLLLSINILDLLMYKKCFGI